MTPARLFTVARFFRVNQFLEREKNAMKNLMMNFLNDDQGQDLIEYTLLLAFVALASAAVFIGAGNSISGIWTSASTKLTTANTAAAS
jgi:Flp pilus assembly pilin Flp